MKTENDLKILWMIPKWTLPVTDGARVATDSLIRNTIAAGAQVDVLCLSGKSESTNPEVMRKHWSINDVHVIPRNVPEKGWPKKAYYLGSFLKRPWVPLTFSSFTDKSVLTQLNLHLSKNRYDIILLDGLHLGASLIHSKQETLPKIIYRAHNIEADLWKKAYREKKNPLLKFILYLQSILVERFEKLITKISHGIAAISQEDLVELQKFTDTRTELVPLGLNFSRPLKQSMDSSIKYLFIGRLDWPPNKDGLEWLLKEVWPEVVKSRPDAILKIVGSGNRDWLKAYQHLRGLEIVGFVEDIRDAYRDCHFTVVPVFYGSGTRIKVLEAFAMGRRLISTKMGVQGADLDMDDYVATETRYDWIKVLSTIRLDQTQIEQLEKSRLKVAAKFCEKSIGSKFYEWLKTV